MPTRSLSDEAQFLKGVGPRLAPAYAKLGLLTVGDVLTYIPRRYEDRRNLPTISTLSEGAFATVKGRLISLDSRPLRGGMVLMRAVLTDRTGSLALTWFNQPWIYRKLQSYEGEIIAYGQVKDGNYGLEIAAPEWEIIEEEADADDFARIMPVYSLTEGLSQKSVRKAARDALEKYLSLVADPLPAPLLREYRLLDLPSALEAVHNPSETDSAMLGRRRLVFEEFFYLQLALALRRAEAVREIGIAFPIDRLLKGLPIEEAPSEVSAARTTAGKLRAAQPPTETPKTLFLEPTPAQTHSAPLRDQLHQILPFTLTGDQTKALNEIWADMQKPHPMNRLVQGDVGSGKTAVAAGAMLAAVRSGRQAVLMAPTELLAEQHSISLKHLFEPLGIRTVLLVGKLGVRDKRAARTLLASGQGHIVVGTQALLEPNVDFHDLGLVVVDEQHRFGVVQRATLREKGKSLPDVLVMTATPIPRTLSITLFGDLDVTQIKELPPGRRPIKTHWKLPVDRASVHEAVRKLLDAGRQAYFVCPMVSESETMLAQAAEEMFLYLSQEVFPERRVALLHGKMKPTEKEAVMDAFRKGESDILVSTTVIEVGVDVPNATAMVVEDANRFGLAQLHQLRGRVGRGSHQSFCVLIADAKSDEVIARMTILTDTTDGFVIAEKDLEMRGPGEVMGTRQSGSLDLKHGDLIRDAKIMEIARKAAIEVVENNGNLAGDEWQLVSERVEERRSRMALISIS